VSTDPAHSLSDAFLCDFTNEPTSPGIDNLHVMEVDPTETMQRELNKWAELAKEIAVPGESDTDGEESSNNNDMVKKIKQFQEWLSGIPGIDEATALSSAIEHIESNKYDLIVFDTAPTGHTLKLLGMPDILQAGIEKLQGWQSTLWGYWDVLKGLGSSASKNRLHAKEEVAQMLENYKTGIQKVALMLQDQRRTRFVVVCIAEYLSISETQRLLRELKKNNVRASHIIVNQLVVENALSIDELTDLEELAEVGSLMLNQELLSKTVHACRLTTARKGIQEKYLSQLKSFPETEEIQNGICEVPLLAEEVTGNDALCRFAQYMVRNPPCLPECASNAVNSGHRRMYDDQLLEKKEKSTNGASPWTPTIGDGVKVKDLEKAAQYNGLEGVIVSTVDPETNRCGVKLVYNGKGKTLSLQTKNMVLLHKAKKAKSSDIGGSSVANESGSVANTVSKAMAVLDDPEIKVLVESNPKFKDAVEDCINNPISFMKYISDPEMSPLISKAMSKLKF
jgi:arsenite-transporting ATPase